MRKQDIDPRIQRWADLMVNHSLGNQFREKGESLEGKLVLVHGESSTAPLMVAISHSVIAAGGNSYLDVFLPTHMRGYNAGLPEFLAERLMDGI